LYFISQFVEAMGKVLGMKQEMESLLPDSRNSVVISEEQMENGSMDSEGRMMGGQIMADDIDANDDYLRQQQNKNKLETVNIVAELCELFGQIDSCGQGTIK